MVSNYHMSSLFLSKDVPFRQRRIKRNQDDVLLRDNAINSPKKDNNSLRPIRLIKVEMTFHKLLQNTGKENLRVSTGIRMLPTPQILPTKAINWFLRSKC